MVAISDTHLADAPKKQLSTPKLIEETRGTSPLKRALLAGFGVATLLSALGVWIVPVDEGDTAMQLVKLVFSISMLVLGMLFISALDNRQLEPEVHLDTNTRQMRIVQIDGRGNAHVEGDFNLDDLSEITLRDRQLTARNLRGEEILSIPVRSDAAERAIRDALSLVN